MNVYSRTLPLPGAVRPVREAGACAPGRSIAAWAPPQSVERQSGVWGAPVGSAIPWTVIAPWSAPDPVMRFDLPAPDLRRTVAPTELVARGADFVKLRNADRQPASTAALAPPSVGAASFALWPAPTPDDLAPAGDERTRITSRLVIGLAAAAGALAAGAAALFSLF